MAADVIDIGSLYKSFTSYVNTYQGGWFRPQTDFQSACNDISNQLWNDYTAKAEKSQEIKDNLRNFLKSENIIVKSEKATYGSLDLPKDYGRFASARIITNLEKTFPSSDVAGCDELKSDEEKTEEFYDSIEERPLKSIDNNKWGAALDHETKRPTLEDPLMTQIQGKFKVAPRQISVVVFDYYVKPPESKFAYTLTEGNPQTGAGDMLVYDEKNSSPVPWPNTMRNEFLINLGERFSIFTRSQFLSQVIAKQKAEV